MTITTGNSSRRTCRRRGFTLAELMISMALASVALAAVLSSFIFLMRSSVATVVYAEMDRDARAALEIFAQEVRMADEVINFSASSVTLHVPTASSSYSINYTYVPSLKAFYRGYGTASQKLLVKGVDQFSMHRYTLQQTAATNNLETKQIQLELRSTRSGPAQAFASNNVISARYILRNKIVSN
ncbi:MAG: PilW family protein [Opitutaceae bacterium]